MLLLLLSRFSRVRLCVTLQTAAHQVPLSLGFSTGVGCHFPLQCMKVKSESKVAQSCLTLSDPMDCSPPGSSVHGIFQARVLEWGAIAFSKLLIIKKPISIMRNATSLCQFTVKSKKERKSWISLSLWSHHRTLDLSPPAVLLCQRNIFPTCVSC